MYRLYGLETEYGITREDLESVDPVVESMELVRAHRRPFRSDWDYSREDPKQDARGFHAKSLKQDQEEEDFERLDRHRPFTFHQMKSDLMLGNGARFYNDHTHPEYSTPECSSLRDLVAHDRAGERILLACANLRNEALGKTGAVQLYKNNTDFHGHSYGCHDNYLLPRAVPFGQIVAGITPFLVTRQIFAGAGKVGIEDASGHRPGLFQISQRADFIEVELSIDTMHERPIVNTRDEPHADPGLYRRLHLILGDANMSEYATALKVGVTWIVLHLIEQGALLQDALIEQPVAALRQISRDSSLKQTIRLVNGRRITPIEHQRLYLESALKAFPDPDEETRWTLTNWEETLRLLEADPMTLADRLDWVAKKWLLEVFMASEGTGWSDPRLSSLDLEYHNLSPHRGLFCALEAEGKMQRTVDEAAIQKAIEDPPLSTRAGVRGLCVQKFLPEIDRIQWERISFKGTTRDRDLLLDRLFDPDSARAEAERIRHCRKVEEIFSR